MKQTANPQFPRANALLALLPSDMIVRWLHENASGRAFLADAETKLARGIRQNGAQS